MNIALNGRGVLDLPTAISELGTAVFDNIVFPQGAYINNDNVLISYEQVVLNSVRVDVTRVKNIVTSQIEGVEGTVKEFVGFDDYEIEIAAVIAPKAGGILSAEIELQKLAAIERAPTAIKVISKYLLTTYGVTDVVINSISAARLHADSYTVVLSCVSDRQIDLKDFG